MYLTFSKHLKTSISLILLLSLFQIAYANNQADICKAYLSNDLTSWKNIINKLELQNPKTDNTLLELLDYYHSYISRTIKVKNKEEAALCLEKANGHLKTLEKKGTLPSLVNVYKSAFLAYEISFSSYKAPLLSGKITNAAKAAITADRNNPLCYIQYGHTEYYKPESFGGSKTLALTNYLKALQMIEKNSSNFLQDWNYFNLLAFIGRTYLTLGNKNMAKFYYDKALKIAPEFWWINTELYPKLLETQ